MPIPLIAKVAVACQALPALAGLRDGGTLPAARRWIVGGAITGLAFNLIGAVLAARGRPNLWLGYAYAPVEVGLALMALSCWHPEGRLRRGLRYGIPAFLAVELVLLLTTVENPHDFSLALTPIKSLLILGASLATLLVLIRREQGGLVQADWFWICVALSVRYGVTAALEPFSRIFLRNDREMVYSAFIAQAWIEILVSLLIARGILCPIPRPASSGSTSPALAPSGSS